MTHMPKSIRASLLQGEIPAARASTKYMETFQIVQPALGGSDVTTYPNAAGNLDIYTIGTNEEIFRFRRNTDVAAPYSVADLNIQGREPLIYTPGGTSSDAPNIMTLGSNGQLKIATYQASTSRYYQTETKPADARETIRDFRGVRGVTGNIYVNVLLDVPGQDYGILANNFFLPNTTTWAGKVWVPMQTADKTVAHVKALAMVENSQVQSAIFAISAENDVLYAESSDRTALLRTLGPKKVTDLSVVVDSGNRLQIFAIEKDTGKVILKREKKYQAPGPKQFEDWMAVDPGQVEPLKSVYASMTYDHVLQVFGIAADGRLWRAGQVAAAKPTSEPTWLSLFPLGNQIPSSPATAAEIFTVGQDKSGYAEAYTVSADGHLTRFWQSPTSQQWFEESIDLTHSDDQMVSVPTHALELVVLDNDGMPLSFTPITITSSFLVTLFVDGLSYRCSQLNPVVASSGPDGKVVLYQKASSLAAATLYIETPSTLSGSPMVVQPNLQLQEKLATLTVDEIKNAKDASGAYLLPADLRANDDCAMSLQQITQASMQIAANDGNGTGKVNFHTVSRRFGAVPPTDRLDLAALEGTTWAIDFTGAYPKFEATTAAEVQAWKSERLMAMGRDGAEASEKGFLGIDWGAVWNGIKTGATAIIRGLTRIVVEVVEGIGRVLIQIGTKTFEAIIKFAQQAFDFVEGVWNWLKVKFKQLFEWLAFLFNFQDFVRSAEAVKHTIGVMLDFTAAGVDVVKQQILSGIDGLKNELKLVVDKFLAELNKDDEPNFTQYASQVEPDPQAAYELDHNLFGNAYQANVAGAKEGTAATARLMQSTALSSSLDELVRLMEDLANNFQFGDGKQAFDEALNYFTAIGDNPNSALQLLMSGITKLMESVALFALDAARGVIALLMDLIKSVIEAFKSLLFAEWEIPVVSQLYELFTGKRLSISAVDIVAYVIAIPGTLLYKIVVNEAPFPNEAALDAYKNYVTVDWMKSKFGLPTEARLAADEDLQKVATIFSLSCYSAAMFVRIFTDGLTGLLSATAPTEPYVPNVGRVEKLKAYGKSFDGASRLNASSVSILMRYATTCFTAPWLLNASAPAPSCPAGSPGFAGTIWICQVLFGPTRGLLLLKTMSGKPLVYTNELTVTAWGWANFGMVLANYIETPNKTTRTSLALSRALCNIIPGQGLRLLFMPDIQSSTYFIPFFVGEAFIVTGYIGSIGVAIAEMIEIGRNPTAYLDDGGWVPVLT